MSSKTDRVKILLAASLGVLGTAVRADVGAGEPFPKPAAADISGVFPDIAGKIVLVDFWASWCAPCRASFPAYARIQSDYAARGLVIVAVSIDKSGEAYAAFLKKFAPPFATVRDGNQNLAAAVGIPGMPASYLLDRHGRVRMVHEGFHTGETEILLRREIESLLNEK
jgi:thiol-disulfide isomerase/thioredoxin